MKLNELKPAPGAKKARRRVGRGIGSGNGKTAGRGQKGQKSRSGYSKGPGWEGGRSNLIERLPKRGFNNNQFRTFYQLVNLSDLNKLEDGSDVTGQTLKEAGIVRHANRPIKLLGNGQLDVRSLSVELDNYSQSAMDAVQAAGGTIRNPEVKATKVVETVSETVVAEAVTETVAETVVEESSEVVETVEEVEATDDAGDEA